MGAAEHIEEEERNSFFLLQSVPEERSTVPVVASAAPLGTCTLVSRATYPTRFGTMQGIES